jgi:hypothetical protein
VNECLQTGYFCNLKYFILANCLVGIRHLNLLKSDSGGERFNMGYANLMLKMALNLRTVQQLNSFLKFYAKPPITQPLKNLPT